MLKLSFCLLGIPFIIHYLFSFNIHICLRSARTCPREGLTHKEMTTVFYPHSSKLLSKTKEIRTVHLPRPVPATHTKKRFSQLENSMMWQGGSVTKGKSYSQ